MILTLKSNPFSLAKRLAKGLASIRDPIRIGTDFDDFDDSDALETVGLEDGGMGAEVVVLGGDGDVGIGTSTGVSSIKSLKAATSDSFSTIIHTS